MPSIDLMQALRIASGSFMLNSGQESSGQASGRIRVRDLRPPLWLADFRSDMLTLDELGEVQALFESLDGSMGTFYAWNPARPWPKLDPEGVVLGASTVTVKSVGMDGKSLALQGLPTGYVLSRGDLVATDFGEGPSRALYRVIDVSVTADGSGDTTEFEVRPHVWAGAAEDDPVELLRPAAEMMVVPNSFETSAEGMFGALSFKAMQVIG